MRELVTLLEQTVVNTLAEYSIESHPRADAPGVYVGERKICSLGLRIRKGCSFHGLALNIAWISHRFCVSTLRLCRYGDDANAPVAAGSLPGDVAPRLVANLLALLNHPHTNIFPGIKRQANVPLSAGR